MLSALTHDSGNEGDGVLGGKEGKEPGSCVEEGSDFVLSKVRVEGG